MIRTQRFRVLITLLVFVMVISVGCMTTQEVTDATTETPTDSKPMHTDGPTQTTASTPGTDKTATVTVTDANEGCTNYLYVRVASDEQINETENRIEYSDLHPDRKEEFKESLEADDSIDIGKVRPPTWEDPIIVEYNGDLYYAELATC